MKLHAMKNRKDRLSFLSRKLGLSFSAIDQAALDEETNIHCENHIGSITVPLGVAGPINLYGENVQDVVYVPLATTEGALVASVNRGAKAFFKQGIHTSVSKVGPTRGPVFRTDSVLHTKKVEEWIWNNMEILVKEAEKTSGHLHLSDIQIKKTGRYIFLRCAFDTDKAMGMNMATIATQQIAQIVSKKTKCQLISVAGNYDIDKKPAWLNVIEGRGFVVQAEGVLSQLEVQNILKTTPYNLFEVWKAKCMIGSALAGSIGFNAHHANIVAAFYAATGQDIAHVVDGSLGMTIVDLLADGSISISVTLPDVLLGTIGGGTRLKTQTEARSMLKTDSPYALAEILAAATICGEVSLLASLAEGSLASAHKTLGR